MSDARVLPADEASIARAVEQLRAGLPVGMPTETVYGLAALATDEAAVARVFAVKERPLFDPLIVHVAGDDPERATAGVVDLDALGPTGREVVRRLWAAFWPGPLTLVLPRAPAIGDLVTAGLGTVAVRMPAHPVAAALILAAGAPLVAPSANRFGRISPTTAADVVAELGDRIGIVLDGGPCEVGLESTVVSVEPDGSVHLLRPGGISLGALEAVAGPVAVASGSARSPGHTPSHYAPITPLRLLPGPIGALDDEALRAAAGQQPAAALGASGDPDAIAGRLRRAGIDLRAVEVLSERGDEREAARRLFAALRRLDGSGARVLLAEPWPGTDGLGHALRDRLLRAAGRG